MARDRQQPSGNCGATLKATSLLPHIQEYIAQEVIGALLHFFVEGCSASKMQSSYRKKIRAANCRAPLSYLETTETVTLISETPRILTFVPDTRRMKSSSP